MFTELIKMYNESADESTLIAMLELCETKETVENFLKATEAQMLPERKQKFTEQLFGLYTAKNVPNKHVFAAALKADIDAVRHYNADGKEI